MKDENKKVVTVIKLQIKAGEARPTPPVGPALGAAGLPIPVFCKEFNDQTKDMGDTIVPVEIYVYEDKTYSFILKSPPAAVLIKKAINLKSGSAKPHVEKVGTIKVEQLEEIVKIKEKDLNAFEMKQAVKIIAGTARSMGVKVEGRL